MEQDIQEVLISEEEIEQINAAAAENEVQKRIKRRARLKK